MYKPVHTHSVDCGGRFWWIVVVDRRPADPRQPWTARGPVCARGLPRPPQGARGQCPALSLALQRTRPVTTCDSSYVGPRALPRLMSWLFHDYRLTARAGLAVAVEYGGDTGGLLYLPSPSFTAALPRPRLQLTQWNQRWDELAGIPPFSPAAALVGRSVAYVTLPAHAQAHCTHSTIVTRAVSLSRR